LRSSFRDLFGSGGARTTKHPPVTSYQGCRSNKFTQWLGSTPALGPGRHCQSPTTATVSTFRLIAGLGDGSVSTDEPGPTPPQAASPSGERRQVTVLFADMVGFTAISERLGEEGTYALIQPIYELMAGVVREQGGSVKDFTGDGIMALFGVPVALEDGPLRAYRAGIADPGTACRGRPRNRGQAWRTAPDADRDQHGARPYDCFSGRWPVIRYATVRGLSRLAGTEPHA
jgi:hypothetical protein